MTEHEGGKHPTGKARQAALEKTIETLVAFAVGPIALEAERLSVHDMRLSDLLRRAGELMEAEDSAGGMEEMLRAYRWERFGMLVEAISRPSDDAEEHATAERLLRDFVYLEGLRQTSRERQRAAEAVRQDLRTQLDA